MTLFPTDSSGHPDVEVISEYQEELLPDDSASAVRAHIDECPDCRETLDALDELRELLGESEFPPLPADIALRIDVALAVESGLRAEQGPSAPVAEQPIRSGPGRSTGRTTGRPQGAAHTTPGGPKAPPAPGRPNKGRRSSRWLRRAALGVGGAAVIGCVVTLGFSLGGPGPNTSTSAERSVVSNAEGATGTAYVFTAVGFTAQIQSLVASDKGSVAPRAMTQGQESGAAAAEPSNTTPPACVLRAVDRPGQSPITSAFGNYQGTAAFALVYPGNSAATSVEAYLVTADCTPPVGGRSAILLQRTVPLP